MRYYTTLLPNYFFMDRTNLQELFEHVSWVLTKQEMELFGFIAWKFWQDRNLDVHGGNCMH